MIEWFKRKTLISKGLRCDRTRRHTSSSQWFVALDTNPILRCVILILLLLATVRISYWDNSAFTLPQITLTAIVFYLTVVSFMPLIARELWESNHLLTLASVCLVFNLLVNRVIVIYLDPATLGFPSKEPTLACALSPMLLTILVSADAGVFLAVVMALANHIFISLPATSDVVLAGNLFISCSGVFFAQAIRRRSDLVFAGFVVGGVGFFCETVLFFTTGDASLSALQKIDWLFLILNATWALFLGVTTALVVSAILPILEWVFDRITDISWLELTDLNHPLLKRLQLEAPGTYHHSLMVANLAEAAASRIHGNPTMCRTMAYFHDVGKLHKPEMFIENTSQEENPHNSLTPSMSALVIIAHVKEGVSLALQYGLPMPVIDGIQQHHGTTVIYYFYKKALQQQEDAKLGSEILKLSNAELPQVDKNAFQYPGPIPTFRESAILSLADAIESSSRSLRTPTLPAVENLVQSIVNERLTSGQLDESGLTLDEIRAISDQFVHTLKTMFHVRIPYPKEKRENETSDDSDKLPKTSLPESLETAKTG